MIVSYGDKVSANRHSKVTQNMQIGTADKQQEPNASGFSPSSVGDRLKAWRRSRGETQDTLSKLLEVDVGVLRKYENGVNAPGSQFLARACNLGLNINWLLTSVGPMIKPDFLTKVRPELGAQLLALADVLVQLEGIDRGKFALLLRGFNERTKEACHTAKLELETRPTLVVTSSPAIAGSGMTEPVVEAPQKGASVDAPVESVVPAGPNPVQGPRKDDEGMADIIKPGWMPPID